MPSTGRVRVVAVFMAAVWTFTSCQGQVSAALIFGLDLATVSGSIVAPS